MADSETTVSQLKEIAKKFADDRDWNQFHGPKELAIGASTESAELLELFRFKTEEQMEAMLKDAKQREKMGEELADVLYFVVQFAQRFDFDLSEIFADKIAKNNKKYPVEKVKGLNKKYDEYS